jgi:formyltetrahydrofolate deformylase
LSEIEMQNSYTLTLSCPDRPGIVAAITSAMFEAGGNIREAQQFEDVENNLFFMRVVFVCDRDEASLRSCLQPAAEELGMTWRISDNSRRKRVLLLVSKFDHCLVDLLYRYRIGELPMNPVGVISNRPQSSLNLNIIGDIPFHDFPVSKETKFEQEAKIKKVIVNTSAELVVLARYMQILSDDLATFLEGRCINIHHSFLPGFKGAKPYHQAHARGVKMIGATAHFVTSDLDDGPIIAQDVEQITHSDRPEDLIRKGRDIERRVLARAVLAFLEDRVLINGKKTVVF